MLPHAFDMRNGWQTHNSLEWPLHIKSMHTVIRWSFDVESHYRCYKTI